MSALVSASSFVAGERVALAADRLLALVGELAVIGDGRWARRCINELQRRVADELLVARYLLLFPPNQFASGD